MRKVRFGAREKKDSRSRRKKSPIPKLGYAVLTFETPGENLRYAEVYNRCEMTSSSEKVSLAIRSRRGAGLPR